MNGYQWQLRTPPLTRSFGFKRSLVTVSRAIRVPDRIRTQGPKLAFIDMDPTVAFELAWGIVGSAVIA